MPLVTSGVRNRPRRLLSHSRAPAPAQSKPAASSSGAIEPAGVRSCAIRLATACRRSFTGVGTPCRRPSSTISPFSQSASMLPVPRCEALPGGAPAAARAVTGWTNPRVAAALVLGRLVRHHDAGGCVTRSCLGPVPLWRAGLSTAFSLVPQAAWNGVRQVAEQLQVLVPHDSGVARASKPLPRRSSAIRSASSSLPEG